ncbi:uncharacterized protein PV06_08312 [Exophiala oligosperma]|uniref:Uncharacterized protein n=1 Tax=Exophiala oligosperma TaxID=215243 RepID=A0A0D2D9C1_9EURO|nr:uncharacterized protein PV06_08312 [Exophiala oligosperma]KIW39723.1 hypothetical protein PV06_08312 [Exophiala oligosperma]
MPEVSVLTCHPAAFDSTKTLMNFTRARFGRKQQQEEQLRQNLFPRMNRLAAVIHVDMTTRRRRGSSDGMPPPISMHKVPDQEHKDMAQAAWEVFSSVINAQDRSTTEL